MKNVDVIKDFNKGKWCTTGRLTSIDNRLFSYGTCIAQRRDGEVYLNITKYSATTSRHQLLVMNYCSPHIIISDTNIPRDTKKLDKYIDNEI